MRNSCVKNFFKRRRLEVDGGNFFTGVLCVIGAAHLFSVNELLISVQFYPVPSIYWPGLQVFLQPFDCFFFGFGLNFLSEALTRANVIKVQIPASDRVFKMQQPSIGGWSVALVTLFLFYASFINANQGRLISIIHKWVYLRGFWIVSVVWCINRFNETVNIEIITTG